jgi:hypothetical protein
MVFSEGTTEKFPSDTTGDRSRDRPTISAANSVFSTNINVWSLRNPSNSEGTLVPAKSGTLLKVFLLNCGRIYHLSKA